MKTSPNALGVIIHQDIHQLDDFLIFEGHLQGLLQLYFSGLGIYIPFF